MKAELENVSKIILRHDTNLCIDVCNPTDNNEIRSKVIFNPSNPLDHSSDDHNHHDDNNNNNDKQSDHHLRLKWEGDRKHYHTLKVLTTVEVKSTFKKMNKKKNDIKKIITKDGGIPTHYDMEDSGNYVPLLVCECRGLQPMNFYPMGQGEFIVTSTSGVEFGHRSSKSKSEEEEEEEADDDELVDFSDGDWTDYDTENDHVVSISDISFRWEAI